jgi:4-amino-4-deoxy-L-arabinose transferase-like glycosyltransferase
MSDPATQKSSSWTKRILNNRAWLLLGLAILLVIVVRVRLREMPLERDEGEYAYAGQLLLQGVPPYKDVYNMKLPGTYAAYAVIMAVFGQTPSGIHLGLMLVNVGSILLVFLIGRKLLDEVAGLAAAVSFALLSMSPSVLGLAGHATHFIAFFALAGTLLLLKVTEGGAAAVRHNPALRSPYSALLLSGVLFGLAFLMKQHGIFFCAFGVLFLAWVGVERWLAVRTEEAKNRRGGKPAQPGRAATAAQTMPAPSVPRLNAIAAKRAGTNKPEIQNPAAVASPKPELRSASEASSMSAVPDQNPEGLFQVPSSQSTAHGPSPVADAPRSTPQAPPGSPVFGLWSLVPGLLCFAAGLILPYLLTCLILLASGVLHEFFFWTVTYAGKYVSAVPLVKGTDVLRGSLQAVVGPNFVLWVLPWLGALLMWWEPRLGVRHRVLLTLLLFCSLGSVSVGLYFREHYFITLLPVLGLLIGVAVSRSIDLVKRDRSIELFAALAVLLLFVIAIGASVVGTAEMWFVMSPAQVVRNSYGTTLYTEAAKAAEAIKGGTSKDARVAVLGSEPEILFYSGRRSATGYIYMYPLMEKHEFAGKMQERMIMDIERARPEYIVFVDDNYSWLKREDSELKILEWWNAYWPTNMELVSTAKIMEGQEEGLSLGKRGGPDPAGGAGVPKTLFLYARKRTE